MNADDLAPFVPRLAVELGAKSGDRYQSVEGSMLSADISGFTALSERLAAKGKAGAEEITELINRCFTVLIDCGHSYDGEVLKFGGDAILVLFRGAEHEVRAVTAGLGMQEALRSLASARRARLSMTVGIDTGPFDTILVGSSHRELLITGTAATSVINLEAAAANGGTLASEAVTAALSAKISDADGGGMLTSQLVPTKRPAIPEDINSFVPRAVSQQLAAFRDAGGEHRITSVGFAMVKGAQAVLDRAGGQALAESFGELIDHTVDACRRYGATLLHSDIGVDGAKLVLTAGAPITMGYDEDALLQIALSVASLDTELDVRVGVHRGRVFAGYLGSRFRRTYTVMGDPVNTAARLLGVAERGEVVATEEILEHTATVFKGHALEPFSVKGKSEKLHAQVVERATGEAKGDHAPVNMVGRSAEIQQVRALLGPAGGVAEILGATGSGKTRLVHEAITGHGERDILRSACRTYDASTPYAALQPLLRSACDIEAWADAASAGEQLTELVQERCAETAPWLPLIGVALGADVAPTAEVDNLDSNFRRSRLEAAVEELLVALADTSMCYFIDDTQWLDAASAELLTHLISRAAVHGWTMITASHLNPQWRAPEVDDLLRVEVEGLDAPALRNIVVEASTRPLSDHEIATVLDRCGGSPLYAIELARAISADGAATLPESVEELIARRIDALDPDNRRLVRIASVLGTEFRTSDLAAVTGMPGVGERLQSADLVGILQPRKLGTWGFTQALFRDASYEGLTFSERRKLHAQIGEHFEQFGSDGEDVAALLSLHFSEARRHAKAWKYSVTAGDRAVEQDAHVEAAEAYGRALDAGRWAKVDKAERATIAVRLGDAAERCGLYDTARESYTKARKFFGQNTAAASVLFRKQGVVWEREGEYKRALAWYRRGLNAKQDAVEKVELDLAVAGVHFRQGRYDQTWHECEPIANDQTASPAARVRASYIMLSAAVYLDNRSTEDLESEAMKLVEAVDEVVIKANFMNNLGVVAYYAGDWPKAATLWNRSFELRDGCGDVIGAVTSLNNIAEIRSDQGRYAEARDHLESALRRGRAANYVFGATVVEANLGRVAVRQGDFETGRTQIAAAGDTFRSMGSDWFTLDTGVRLLEADVAAGDFNAAVAAADNLLADKTVKDVGATILAPAHRLRGQALIALDRHDDALLALTSAAEAAEAENLQFERALALAGRAELDHPAAKSDRMESQAVFKQLGVKL